MRDAVALFDQMSFAKFLVQGPDACRVLNHLSTANVDVAVGRIVYTQWLNDAGGIEADLTVTRTGERDFLVVTSAICQTRDLAWLRRAVEDGWRALHGDGRDSGHRDARTHGTAEPATAGSSCRARTSAMPRIRLRRRAMMEIGYARVRAARITYVGELGWELYVSSEFVLDVYERLLEAGLPLGLRHAGYHAMSACRVEKGYRHWSHDIADEDTPLEAGLGFTVAWDKPGGFRGRDAILARRGQSILPKRLVQLRIEGDSAASPMLHHEEPIVRDGQIVGSIRSGAYGHRVGGSLGMGYVHNAAGVSAQWLETGRWEVEVACERYPARVQLAPWYDPRNLRIKGES